MVETMKKKRIPKILLALIFFSLLCVIFAIFAPMLISTSWGKGQLINILSKELSKDLEIDELSLSWLGPQKIRGFRLKNSDQSPLLTFDTFESSASLFKLLSESHNLGKAELISPYLCLSAENANPLQAFSLKPKNASFIPQFELMTACAAAFPPFLGQIDVKKAKVELFTSKIDKVSFENIDAYLQVPSSSSLSVLASGKTSQQMVNGEFSIQIDAKDLKSAVPALTAKITANELPVKGIDQIVSFVYPELQGSLVEAIGTSLNLNLQASLSNETMDLSLALASSFLNGAIQTKSQGTLISLVNPAQINFTLTPALIKILSKASPDLPTLSLMRPAKLQINMHEFSLPITNQEIDFQSLAAKATVDLLSTELYKADTQNPLLIDRFQIAFETKRLSEDILLKITSSMQFQKTPSSLSIDAVIKHPLLEDSQTDLHAAFMQIPLQFFDPANASFTLSSLFGPAPNLDLTIKQLKIPASISQMTASIQMRLEALHVDRIFNCGPLSLDPLTCQIEVDTFQRINLQAEANGFKASLACALKEEGRILQMTKPLVIEYTLTNAKLQALCQAHPNLPTLMNEAPFSLTLNPLSVSLSDFNWKKVKLQGELAIKELSLQSPEYPHPLSLQKTSLKFEADSSKSTAFVNFHADVRELTSDNSEHLAVASSNSSIDADITIEHLQFDPSFDTSQTKLLANVDVHDLSCAFLETLAGKTRFLTLLVGPSIDLHLKLESSAKNKLFSIKTKSRSLNIDAHFALNNGRIQLQDPKTPAEIYFTLTQDSYAVLDEWLTGQPEKQAPFQLKQPSLLVFTLSQLDWPLKASSPLTSIKEGLARFTPDWSLLQMNLQMGIDKFSFLEKSSGQNIQVSQLILDIQKVTAKSPLDFTLNASIQTKTGNSLSTSSTKEGKVAIIGKLDSLFSPSGSIDFKNLSTQIESNIQEFPVAILDVFSRALGNMNPLSPLFGDTLNATASMQIQNLSGPIHLNIRSPNTRVSLEGQLANGTLMLNETVHAQISMTKELSAWVLNRVNPLSLSSIATPNPLTLEIDSEGVAIPIFPFDLTRLFIPQLRLELGHLTCKNEGTLHLMLGLLRSNQFSKGNSLSLWFAPIDMHIQKGIIDCERTEILVADTFDIALWGTIDLPDQSVDMVLGLTAQALSKSLGIKNLPDDYVMHIPMKGKMDNVKINSAKATAKMAALLAWQQQSLAGALGGGTSGALLGGLLKSLGTLPDKNAKTPPAKHPFPWENGTAPKETTPKPPSKKRKINTKDKPLKQLWKLIQ